MPARGLLFAAIAIALVTGTLAFASVHRFAPYTGNSPVAAVAALKKSNLARVLNDYDFGGYLIAGGVAPFIEGAHRTLWREVLCRPQRGQRPDGARKSVPAAG
jgi:hypothetical protein